MTVALPSWVLWLQAVGPFSIAIAAAGIAFGQWRLAVAKRQDDLFDRRYNLLAAYRSYFKSVRGEAEGLPRDMSIYDVADDDHLELQAEYLELRKEDLLAKTAMLFDETLSRQVGRVLDGNREDTAVKYQYILRLFRGRMS